MKYKVGDRVGFEGRVMGVVTDVKEGKRNLKVKWNDGVHDWISEKFVRPDYRALYEQEKALRKEYQKSLDDIKINYFKPISADFLLENYEDLRPRDDKRDGEYCPIHDSIMRAISKNLKEHNPDQFNEVWTGSLFPERLTKEVLRLFEAWIIDYHQQLKQQYNGQDTGSPR